MIDFAETRIGFADIYGTTAEVMLADDGEIQLRIGIGQSGGTGYPTPAAARQLASALIDAAEAAESKRDE